MSLSGIRTHFRTQIAIVSPSFREWRDGFNYENIPANIYDKSYHLSYAAITGGELAAEHQPIEVSFVVRFFFKGYRDVATNLDEAIDLCERVIKQVQDPSTRLGSEVKNIKFITMVVEPSFASNDNLILVTQTYLVTEYFCLGGN